MKTTRKTIDGREWICFETNHFLYRVSLNKGIDFEEVKRSDEHLDQFCKVFEIETKKKIAFYSLLNKEDMKKWLENSNAQGGGDGPEGFT